jgi:hypothetical protein
MSTIPGVFNTTGLKSTQDLAALSFDRMITRLMPNGTAPLFALTSYLTAETAVQTEHGYYAKTALFPYFVLAADVTASDTEFTVDSTETIIEGMIFQLNNTAKENVLVEAVISDTVIRVRRAMGGTAGTAATDVSAFMVGNAYEEASIRPTALNITPKRITNLTQIFRNTWALSGTVQATSVIAGDTPTSESKQDCAAMHAQSIEAALFFGKKYEGVRKGQPFRTMDGLISIISDIDNYPESYTQPNVWNAGATTNFTQLEGFLDPVFNQTTDPKVANERLLFVGGKARSVLNNIGRLNATYDISNGETSFGLQFSQFKTSRGTFRMVEHPLFNSNPIWSKSAVCVDLSSFKMAYLGGRKTQNKEFNTEGQSAQDFGIDAVGGTLTTECTALVKNPPANAIITNLTAAAQG